MVTLLSKLNGTKKSALIEPREIFMALPQKDKRYEYPRDVQSEVWRKWFDVRDNKNCIIKMNTGSGKTIVGLMILQSCLNEGKGPAVYVVPDNYLVAQVCEEAKNLGILAVMDREDYSYLENKAILVTTIYALVNGHSVFGMRQINNYQIGSILMDDVHSCLNTITTQFSIKVPSDHELYNEILDLFSEQWKSYNNKSYIDIVKNKHPKKNEIIPFWIWQDKQSEVYSLLSKYNNTEEKNNCVYFNLPLLTESLSICDCFVTAQGVEIIPEGIAISKIKSFVDAQRRIFMSATLSDDSVFISAIGLHKDDVKCVISPDNANDIGDRLILFPRHLNNKITDEEIKNKVLSIAANYNVVVLVPSNERAKFWDLQGDKTVKKNNIEEAVASLKNKHVGLLVFVNRYDGIDLPDDACRMLVIDGLPPLRNEKDKYIQSIDSCSTILIREQIQRIEQGMGRGVRSNSDSCCVVLMGDKLADVLVRNKGAIFFSNATREQYDLSKDLWDLLKQQNPEPNVDDVFELADYSLSRELEWIQKSKERLSIVMYTTELQFDNNILALRNAYDLSMKLQWQNAIAALDGAINCEEKNSTKGYLLQIKAKLTNFFDRAKAQEILLAARAFNMGTLAPLSGISYGKAINSVAQSKAICDYIKKHNILQNNYVIYINAVTASLAFSSEANEFESSLQSIGEIIGFISTRPEKETCGKGPDNLWAIGNNKYLVIECKNASSTETISKDYCNQLGGSVRWFDKTYGDLYSAIPVMVHKSIIIDKQATAVANMRIITLAKLELLKEAINNFAIAISQNDNWLDEKKINSLLSQYKLRSNDIINNYMVPIRN